MRVPKEPQYNPAASNPHTGVAEPSSASFGIKHRCPYHVTNFVLGHA